MKRLNTASAIYNESRRNWKCNVQKDGVRKSFYSSLPGKKGKAEAEYKAQVWLESQVCDDPIFETAFKAYMENRKLTVGTSGQTMDEWAFRLYLLPALGKKKLSKITVQDWQDVLDSAVEQGKSKASVNDIKARMTGFRKFCRKKRWPIEEMDLLEVNTDKKREKRILSREDIKLVFTDNRTLLNGLWVRDQYWNAYRFAIVMGLRRGEIAGLQWDDISSGWMQISRAVNSHGEMTNGKNENARRRVRLTQKALEILEDQRAFLQQEKVVSPWVFPNIDTGNHAVPITLYARWTAYLEAHDIEHISFHEMRHTMISLNKRMPGELLKAMVGHSKSMDTFGVYGHMQDEDYYEAAEDIDKTLTALLG